MMRSFLPANSQQLLSDFRIHIRCGRLGVAVGMVAQDPWILRMPCPGIEGSWLHQAVLASQVEMCQWLIPLTKNLNTWDQTRQNTPLRDAIALNLFPVAKMLLDAGADPNLGRPVFPLASKRRADAPQMLTDLRAAGACINDVAKGGDTPLTLAIADSNLEMVRTLLVLGADVYPQLDARCNALERARRLGRTDMLELLESWLQAQSAQSVVKGVIEDTLSDKTRLKPLG